MRMTIYTRLGKTEMAEYSAWRNMIYRCYKPKSKDYPNYGGRGILVCDRWLESFENFLEDIGPKPKCYSLERIDNDGNYEPSNCKWATRAEQASNRRPRQDGKRDFKYEGPDMFA